jgi:threonine dehydratase
LLLFILVPYGGDGLITGITSATKHLKPSVDVFACEIETAAPLSAALNAGDVTKIAIKKSWIDAIGHELL